MSARAVSIAPQCGGQWSVRGRPILVNEHTELHSAINQRMTGIYTTVAFDARSFSFSLPIFYGLLSYPASCVPRHDRFLETN